MRILALLGLVALPTMAQVVAEPSEVDLGRGLPADSAVVRAIALRNQGAAPVPVGKITGDSVVSGRAGTSVVTTRDVTALTLVARPPQGLRRPLAYRGRVTVQIGRQTLTIPVRAGFVPAPTAPRPLPAEVYGAPYQAQPGDRPAEAVVFYGGECVKCLNHIDQVLEPLRRHFGGLVRFTVHDTVDRANLALLYRYRDRYRGGSPASVTWFVGGQMLPCEQIDSQPYYLLLSEIRQPTPVPREALLRRPQVGEELARMSRLVVLCAGVLDGINPCALATAVFLVALLTQLGRRRRALLLAGGAFTAAVFTTYLLLGLGVLRMIGALDQRVAVGVALRWLVAALTAVVAAGQLRDALALAKGAPTRHLTVQMPLRLKQRVHAVLRRGLAAPWLVVGSAGAGMLVTLLEAVCTSQVYLPILVGLQLPATREHAWPLLVIYNLGFIAPLLLVLALACAGVGSPSLAALARRHLGLAKAVLGLVLLSLSLWLLRPELFG